jgi:allantoinase
VAIAAVGEIDLILRGRRILATTGERAAQVAVRGGHVAAVLPWAEDLASRRRVELDDDVVLLPGLVDTHVHVNEPGRTEWEGFASATRAAAAGGLTTLVDMPLNSVPPTLTVAALEAKRAAAAGQCAVDVGFWGGVVPGNVAELRPLHQGGVLGFKCFLSPSGMEEFPHCTTADLELALPELAALDALLVVHAEDPEVLDTAPARGGPRYADFLASRPDAAETSAIARLIELARRFDARVHVVHVSSAEALPLLRAARRDGVRISAETCPHYLSLAAEEVPDGATAFKCCPPIRDLANQDALWEGLADGSIGCVVSDHSPCTVELKARGDGDFAQAWGGISSLQLGLPVVWTEAHRRGHSLTDVARWMANGPAQLVGLAGKGAIAAGHDADFTVLAPDETFTVDPARLAHKNPLTPYAGLTLQGVVRGTWLRGEEIAADRRGRLLSRQ